MTAMMNSAITRFVVENNYGTISARLGLFVVVPVIALLVERELLRALEPDPKHQVRIHALTGVIVPLLAALTLILGLRFMDLLR